MAKFDFVSKFKNAGLALPIAATQNAAGYDLAVAEDTVVPSYVNMIDSIRGMGPRVIELESLAAITKSTGVRPTLVSTGLKCYLGDNEYLELSVRSSTPLKYWLILANEIGVIDADYADNPTNEGEIFLQLINLSPYDIQLRKGDVIGQGIIKEYLRVEDDRRGGKRTGGFGSTSKTSK